MNSSLLSLLNTVPMKQIHNPSELAEATELDFHQSVRIMSAASAIWLFPNSGHAIALTKDCDTHKLTKLTQINLEEFKTLTQFLKSTDFVVWSEETDIISFAHHFQEWNKVKDTQIIITTPRSRT